MKGIAQQIPESARGVLSSSFPPPKRAGNMEHRGGIIAAVAPGSVAAQAGLCPGDELLSINGHPVRDVIDVQFYGAEERLVLRLRREGQELERTVERAYDQPLGLEFVDPLFDGIRLCNNHCPFCFLRQMPPGLRRSLYLKDDDYRLSFLSGNFITLTNLTPADWARLEEQRLSPLYVSVHATDPALRRRMLGNPRAPDVREQLRRLGEIGIQTHTQVVLVPGLNDGPALEQTVTDLGGLFPAVQSVAIVPVGLTRYQRGGLRPYTPAEAEALLDRVAPWQAEFRRRFGLTFVYPADEWFLLAGREVPPAEEYDGFPQIENGVGMVRDFLDEFANGEWRTAKSEWRGRQGVVVCGTLIAPLMRRVMEEFNELTGARLRVTAVENAFFGPTVTVSGLLTGQDVVATLRRQDLGGAVYLPCTMFDATGERTLDDMTREEIQDLLGVPVLTIETIGEITPGRCPLVF